MKTNLEQMDQDPIYKDVLIIGNGPSGIVTSLMLSGQLPHLVSHNHPDEMLSARLKSTDTSCLITQDLAYLAQGLEGRSTNPVSLLADALLHPCADLGLDLDPLVEFHQGGKVIDHLVLGQGPPGGSWHRIDPDVLTLSLGSWMALPGKPFPTTASNEKRAFSRDVAAYYQDYVDEMGLNDYFVNDTMVTSVVKLKGDSGGGTVNEDDEDLLLKRKMDMLRRADRDILEWVKDLLLPTRTSLNNMFNCVLTRGARRGRHCRRLHRNVPHADGAKKLCQAKSDTIIIPKHERKKPILCCGDTETITNNTPTTHSSDSSAQSDPHWLLETMDVNSGATVKYACKYLVLACGTYDSPNRLEVFKDGDDPDWLVHDLRGLETKLDQKLRDTPEVDPVLVVGAGLSAADAVMAVRSRNVPVVHVFRGRSAEFTRQLPENMYPEYHKVRQMMNDGGSTYPLYTAYPEHSVISFDEDNRTVKLATKTGEESKLRISFAAVLIGSRPNLSFMPPDMELGVFPERPLDSKTNPINIDPLTHEVNGQEGLFAVGPLAGDNFVRYIPGGAIAVVAELYKKMQLTVDCKSELDR